MGSMIKTSQEESAQVCEYWNEATEVIDFRMTCFVTDIEKEVGLEGSETDVKSLYSLAGVIAQWVKVAACKCWHCHTSSVVRVLAAMLSSPAACHWAWESSK